MDQYVAATGKGLRDPAIQRVMPSEALDSGRANLVGKVEGEHSDQIWLRSQWKIRRKR